MNEDDAKRHVQRWLDDEISLYARGPKDSKYAVDTENRQRAIDAMTTEGLGDYWLGFITNYLRRAELLGVDTPQGRQALGKTITTLMHCLETAVLVHGPMPAPGVPSGQIAKWDEPVTTEKTWPYTTPSMHVYNEPTNMSELQQRSIDFAQGTVECWDEAEMPPQPTWAMLGLALTEIYKMQERAVDRERGS